MVYQQMCFTIEFMPPNSFSPGICIEYILQKHYPMSVVDPRNDDWAIALPK